MAKALCREALDDGSMDGKLGKGKEGLEGSNRSAHNHAYRPTLDDQVLPMCVAGVSSHKPAESRV